MHPRKPHLIALAFLIAITLASWPRSAAAAFPTQDTSHVTHVIVQSPNAGSSANALLPTRAVFSANRAFVPILMYHHLEYLRPNASWVMRLLTVAPSAFEQQIAYLAAHHYHTITFSDLIAYFRYRRPLPSNPIILTFDDAWAQDYWVAFPILRRYGMVGTFFAPTGYMNHISFALTWSEVREMSRAGMEIGDHTIDHPFLTRQSTAQVWHEIADSKAVLERFLGRPVVAFAYPFGSYNGLVINLLARAGYGAAVTTNAGNWQYAQGIYTLHRTTVPYWDNLSAFAALLRQ